MEALAAKWFTIYYLVLGTILLISGLFLMAYFLKARDYLILQAQQKKPPHLLRTILKYLFLFTIPCLILSFFPFSWIELLFSLWSLLIVYTTGILIVRWEQTRLFILNKPALLERFIRLTGASMVAVSLVIFALSYLVINHISPF